MANALFHRFVSGKADGADATKVQASNWNSSLKAANGTQNMLLMYDPAGDATTLMSWTANPILASVRTPILDTNADTPYQIRINGTTRWNFGSSGTVYALYPNVDSTTDLGTAGFRVQNGYINIVYSSAVISLGSTVNLVTIAAFDIIFTTTNVTRWRINSAGPLVAEVDNTYDIGTPGALRPRDIHVARNLVLAGGITFSATGAIISDSANTLSFRNGINAQTFNIFRTFTNAANYEMLCVCAAGGTGYSIFGEELGTGVARTLGFGTASTLRWEITVNGDFRDINSNRGIFASYIVPGYGGGTPATVGAVRLPNGQFIVSKDFVGADQSLIGMGADSNVVIGSATANGMIYSGFLVLGTSVTAAFPALKRSAAVLQVRLADDSAYGDIEFGKAIAHTAFKGPGTTATVGDIQLKFAGYIYSRDTGNSADLKMMGYDTANILFIGDTIVTAVQISAPLLQIGGATAAYPALKRLGAVLQVRLADDTGLSDIQIQNATAGNVYASAAISVGPTTWPTTGAINLSNNASIKAENAAGSADVQLLVLDASNIVTVGGGNFGILLQPGTQDIKWGKALVALGAGAAATLGLIGGSGPATAAQNTWLRLLDSAGVACWVPVWK